jgi:putative ABC transport system permease protein
VTPGYFRLAGIPVLRGRDLEERDDETASLVTLVNESMVRAYFPKEDPIGQRITIWNRSFEIVGVVADVKFRGPRQAVPIAIYPPLAQLPMPGFVTVLRSDLELEALARMLRAELRALDPDLPLASIESMETVLASSVAPARFNAVVLGLFAAAALLLASLGIYGVVSYSVAERRREIGLRMSLGARRLQIQGQVLGQGLVLTAIGLGIGLVAALALGRVLESLLFGVTTTDVLTLVAVTVALAAVSLLAGYLPARRASRVDPAVALRYE